MTVKRSIDVLIVTTLRSEYDAVLDVHAGAFSGSDWQMRPGPLGHEVAFRVFASAGDGKPLEVAVTWATDMGTVASASGTAQLIAEYAPRCIAMCGVCAGRRGDVNVGDVIVADRLWLYDSGKLKAEYDAEGNRSERVQGDVMTFNLRPDWKRAAEEFGAPDSMRDFLRNRPRPIEQQADWVLERLVKGENPHDQENLQVKAPQFADVMDLLWKKKLVEDGTLNLTEAGKKRIHRLLIKYPSLPEPAEFKVHVGSIGIGNKVIQDPQIFNRLSENMRKVLGLEMEAMSLGAIAHAHQESVPYMIVMKGVMDHADDWRSDAVKQFAARAAAECLLAFLRQHLPPVDRFLDILDPGSSIRPTSPAPSALLHARHEYIPFYEPGRADILKRLETFCEVSEPVGLWLIHGESGMGKTRLLIEACRRLREKKGWVAGFLGQTAPFQRFEALLASDLPAMVVIDYAESRPALATLLDSLARLRSAGKRAAPLRVVLLARNAGDWLDHLRHRDGFTKDLLAAREPEALARLVHSVDERREVVREAASRFAAVLGVEAPTSPMPTLDDERFESTLYLHIAALAWVNGIPIEADTLMNEILEHEERFWVLQADAFRDAIGEQAFVAHTRNAVAGMTLCGGMASWEAGKALLHRVNGVVDERLLLLLRRLYPAHIIGTYASPLEPDLLGDGMVWRTLRILRERGDSPTAYLDRVFQNESDSATMTGFGVLGRLSVAHSDDVGPWLAHLLDADLERRASLALDAAKALGTRTALACLGLELSRALERRGTVELAMRLEARGVPDGTVSLREVREWVSRKRLVLYSRDDETIEARAARAGLLHDLGTRQDALGQREAALGSIQEAVEIYRALAKARPDAFLSGLAISLVNLGGIQSDLGQRDAALASTTEAVAIHRTLAKDRPDAFLSDLAASVNNLGIMQSGLGQREAALASTREAVETFRALARARPDAFLPDLAMGLINLGMRQSELGQREAALGSTMEAVETYRALARARPDAFLPDLAMGLNNLGMRQSELGHREAALGSTMEAVETYRALAKDRPDVFMPDLGSSLNTLAVVQNALGQREAALASTREAVEIRRAQVKAHPDAFLPALAESLFRLSEVQNALDQHEPALASGQEAEALFHKLSAKHPAVFLPDLGRITKNLVAIHKNLGHREAAVDAMHDARNIFRTLANTPATPRLPPGDTHTSPLAWTLVRDVGPIQEAEVMFGDLTVLVGPQATGKSVFLQLFKLCVDAAAVQTVLRRFNVDWQASPNIFFELYFGEGMGDLWSPNSSALFGDGVPWDLAACANPSYGDDDERVFFIPAQRVLSLREGMTRTFLDYRAGDPFVLRQFSDTVDRLMKTEFANDPALFPRTDRLDALLGEPIAKHIFGQFNLQMDLSEHQKRLVLGGPQQKSRLPYLVWSAGQREFVPLLLGIYWLLPRGGGRRAGVDRVVIEEIEMGLHPRAISATMALVLELMRRGYRVCLSTHSSHVLDVVWALQFMQKHGGTTQDVRAIFGLDSNPITEGLAQNALRSILQVHYFPRNAPVVDISELDPGAESTDMAGWGGLTEFSGHVGDIVARVARRADGDE